MFALVSMSSDLPASLFTPAQREELSTLLDVDLDHPVSDLHEVPAADLARCEVVISGWGAGRIDAELLASMPRLRAILHTAGTVRFVASDAVFDREDILLTSATAANAIPVAEFSLAQILLAGKRSLSREHGYRSRRRRGAGDALASDEGNYRAVVGLIGASHIGRLVAEHLRPFDLDVVIADPYVEAEEITALGARKVDLDELFSASDVVSIHAPDVPSTRGLVSRDLLALMRTGTTLINTARPALVDLDALREALVSGRLSAVLDVHDNLAPDDPIWDAPTVSITPHLAGSHGNELHRMAESAVEEVRRLVRGQSPAHPVDRSRRDISA